jgi:hypothetical protein
LLKITIYDKSTVKHQTQLQVSLVEIRDSLNELIKSFGVENKKEGGQVIEKSTEVEEVKKTRRLTPAELGRNRS